jgi:phage terminase large subunit
VLGIEPWGRQQEVLRALAEHDWVTVRSGNGVGKSALDAMAARWYSCTRGPGNAVILTSSKFSLINEVLWSELRRQHMAAKRPLGGDLSLSAMTGLRTHDERRILGLTATDPAAFAGVRRPEMMIIADEASGIPDTIFEAVLGMASGGAKILLTGNPLESSGFFFESHKSEKFRRFHISSLEASEQGIPGMVTRSWIESMKHAWGESSPMYRIRVLGEFVEQQEGRLFPPSLIMSATQAWKDCPAEGRLIIGCDPAGDGGDGDDSAFAVRRGKKVINLYGRNGMTPEAHVGEILGLIVENPSEGTEKPAVVVDSDGLVGARVYQALSMHLQSKESFELVRIRGSEKAKRKPNDIHSWRDEIWLNLVDAIKEGLTFAPHAKLEGDLAAIRFDRLINGRATIVRKNVIRRELGRSPDLGDALSLCAWQPSVWQPSFEKPGDGRAYGEAERVYGPRIYDAPAAFDPYSGSINPYGR